MDEVSKYPFMARRSGSKNLYYKRSVPKELVREGRPKQVWKSLGTSDPKAAKAAYRAADSEMDRQLEDWRMLDAEPPKPTIGGESAAPAKIAASAPLSRASIRRLAEEHYLEVYDHDFRWRADLWQLVQQNEDAFWRGELITHPKNDWHDYKSEPVSYFAHLMEEPELEPVFLYCIHMSRKERLTTLQRRHRLGDVTDYAVDAVATLKGGGVTLSSADRYRVLNRLLEMEIKALEDLIAGCEAQYALMEQSEFEARERPDTTTTPSKKFSELAEAYVEEAARFREWPIKTIKRKRAELTEFSQIVGDRPMNSYKHADGVLFKNVLTRLPSNRQTKQFSGLALTNVSETADRLRGNGERLDMLSPLTINDKIGTVALFFAWAQKQDREGGIVVPVEGLTIDRPRGKQPKKKRHPWSITELNAMFSAPIFLGCHSLHYWQQPGPLVLNDSAKYWVPILSLFSGMRLGEIIQLRMSDIKRQGSIAYFDVTTMISVEDDDVAERDMKSLKNWNSRRAVPLHNSLLELGMDRFIDQRRKLGHSRLFFEYDKAEDDGSWSKRFSKHFTRFRRGIGVTRDGVTFHSLRHNVEDALRNADVRKEIRDAVQGHGENGVSREYGSGYYVETLNNAIQQISYPGMTLPTVE